jgi:hypothetical protein
MFHAYLFMLMPHLFPAFNRLITSPIPYLRWIQVLAVMLTLGFAIALLWAHRRTVSALHRAVLTVTRAAGIPTYRGSPQLLDELARARRYQRPLTVAILKLDDQGRSQKAKRLFRNSREPSNAVIRESDNGVLAFPFVACFLRDALRNGDTVTYDLVKNRLVIVLLEINKAGAAQCMKRLRVLIEERTGLKLRAGLAEFPTDGYTIEAIVAHAQAAAEHQFETQITEIEALETKLGD